MENQLNILWSGIEYRSLENCIADFSGNGVKINSTIVGTYEGMIYQIDFTMSLNRDWQFQNCSIRSQVNNEISDLALSKDGKNWSLNGEYRPELDGCAEIDIPLTPLTNSLPINRLKLKNDQEHEISVVYIDLLENTIRPVNQKYIRIAADRYKYENIPNDFEAEVTVDEYGFVIDYPQLFSRVTDLQSSYPLTENDQSGT